MSPLCLVHCSRSATRGKWLVPLCRGFGVFLGAKFESGKTAVPVFRSTLLGRRCSSWTRDTGEVVGFIIYWSFSECLGAKFESGKTSARFSDQHYSEGGAVRGPTFKQHNPLVAACMHG